VRERDNALRREAAAKRERDSRDSFAEEQGGGGGAERDAGAEEGFRVRQLEARLLEAAAELSRTRMETNSEKKSSATAREELMQCRVQKEETERALEIAKEQCARAKEEAEQVFGVLVVFVCFIFVCALPAGS
jgi:hypothetical protein